jgi:hypothetical protein
LNLELKLSRRNKLEIFKISVNSFQPKVNESDDDIAPSNSSSSLLTEILNISNLFLQQKVNIRICSASVQDSKTCSWILVLIIYSAALQSDDQRIKIAISIIEKKLLYI